MGGAGARGHHGGRHWLLRVLCSALLVLAACGSDGGQDGARTIGRPSNTTPTVLGMVLERETTTTLSSQGLTPAEANVEVGPQSTSPTPKASAGAATTTTLCHPKDDDCNGWWWSSPPGVNQPLTMSLSVTPSNPVVGEEITITVRATDPDAGLLNPFICIQAPGRMWTNNGSDGGPITESGACLIPPTSCERPEGELETPLPAASEREWVYVVTFDGPGSYELSVPVSSRSDAARWCVEDPYGSAGGAVHVIAVT